MPHLTHNLFRLQSRLSFLSSTHSPLPLSLTLLSCLSPSASLTLSCLTPSASLMLSAFRSHSLCRRRWRWNPKILGLTLSSHSLCWRRWRRNPKILTAKILGLTLSCSHVLLPFFLYLISGFRDLDFVVKIWYSLHVLVLDFDFKCIWFLWIGNLNGYGGFDLRFIWICCLCCTAAVILFSQENNFFFDWLGFKKIFFFGWATN